MLSIVDVNYDHSRPIMATPSWGTSSSSSGGGGSSFYGVNLGGGYSTPFSDSIFGGKGGFSTPFSSTSFDVSNIFGGGKGGIGGSNFETSSFGMGFEDSKGSGFSTPFSDSLFGADKESLTPIEPPTPEVGFWDKVFGEGSEKAWDRAGKITNIVGNILDTTYKVYDNEEKKRYSRDKDKADKEERKEEREYNRAQDTLRQENWVKQHELSVWKSEQDVELARARLGQSSGGGGGGGGGAPAKNFSWGSGVIKGKQS